VTKAAATKQGSSSALPARSSKPSTGPARRTRSAG
jgi:hypothetical protein